MVKYSENKMKMFSVQGYGENVAGQLQDKIDAWIKENDENGIGINVIAFDTETSGFEAGSSGISMLGVMYQDYKFEQ